MNADPVLLDPTAERVPQQRPRAPRPETVAGRVVGLLDISKPRGDVFLNRVADVLVGHGAKVRRYLKPTYSRPMPTALAEQITAECALVIEALAD